LHRSPLPRCRRSRPRWSRRPLPWTHRRRHRSASSRSRRRRCCRPPTRTPSRRRRRARGRRRNRLRPRRQMLSLVLRQALRRATPSPICASNDRMKRARFFVLPVMIGTAGALGAGPVAAQPATGHVAPPALSDSLSGPAKDAYRSARILINNGDFGGAYNKYAQAYALSKDPRLLYDMAVCTRSLKAYAKMQSLLVRYQREGQALMSAEDRSDVASALVAIHDLVGTVKLTVTEAGATVAVDDRPPSQGRFDGQLPVGTHDVRVTEPGKVPYRVQLELRDGETRTVQVTLETEKHAAAVWPWIVGGAVVAAGAVVGGYFLFKSSPSTPATPPDPLGALPLSAWGR